MMNCKIKMTGIAYFVSFLYHGSKSHVSVICTCIYSCSVCVYLLGGGLGLTVEECVC